MLWHFQVNNPRQSQGHGLSEIHLSKLMNILAGLTLDVVK